MRLWGILKSSYFHFTLQNIYTHVSHIGFICIEMFFNFDFMENLNNFCLSSSNIIMYQFGLMRKMILFIIENDCRTHKNTILVQKYYFSIRSIFLVGKNILVQKYYFSIKILF